MRRHRVHLVMACLALAACAVPAHATQHLVRAGDSWSHLAQRVRPGDEIILMPGLHEPATLDHLAGNARRPIVIRSVDSANPAVIRASRYGLRLRAPQHVEIRDLTITGAKINGILIQADGPPGRPLSDGAVAGHVMLRNITVERTGPRGLRDAIVLKALSSVRIEQCTIEGWAGMGLEIVACQKVFINHCSFKGRDDHSQAGGIRVRAGSDGIRIGDCSFEEAGLSAICLGAVSDLDEFSPALPEQPDVGSLYEASHIWIENCTFLHQDQPLTLVHCNQVRIQNNSFVRPHGSVISLPVGHTDPGFGQVRDTRVLANMIVWDPGDLERLVQSESAEEPGLWIDENLWWSRKISDEWAELGPLPGNKVGRQLTDVDPRLDETLRPTRPGMGIYGAGGG